MPGHVTRHLWRAEGVASGAPRRMRLDVEAWDKITLQWYTGAGNVGAASAISFYGTAESSDNFSGDDPATPPWVALPAVGFSSLPASGAGASDVIEVPTGYSQLLVEITASPSLSEFTLVVRLAGAL